MAMAVEGTDEVGDCLVWHNKSIVQGGFAVIYQAKHKETNDALIGKRISILDGTRINNDMVRIAQKEMEILNSLQSHQNILKLISYAQTTDSIWLFLELCDKGHLGNYLENNPDMSIFTKLRLISEILSGIAFMHKQVPPIVHRDLKPQNILLKHESSRDVVKIADFGLSKIYQENKTLSQMLFPGFHMHTACGSAYFMAPEFFAELEGGVKYDETVDTFALGLIIKVMIEYSTTKKEIIPRSVFSSNEKVDVAFGYEQVSNVRKSQPLPCFFDKSRKVDKITQRLQRIAKHMTAFQSNRRKPIFEAAEEITEILEELMESSEPMRPSVEKYPTEANPLSVSSRTPHNTQQMSIIRADEQQISSTRVAEPEQQISMAKAANSDEQQASPQPRTSALDRQQLARVKFAAPDEVLIVGMAELNKQRVSIARAHRSESDIQKASRTKVEEMKKQQVSINRADESDKQQPSRAKVEELIKKQVSINKADESDKQQISRAKVEEPKKQRVSINRADDSDKAQISRAKLETLKKQQVSMNRADESEKQQISRAKVEELKKQQLSMNRADDSDKQNISRARFVYHEKQHTLRHVIDDSDKINNSRAIFNDPDKMRIASARVAQPDEQHTIRYRPTAADKQENVRARAACLNKQHASFPKVTEPETQYNLTTRVTEPYEEYSTLTLPPRRYSKLNWASTPPLRYSKLNRASITVCSSSLLDWTKSSPAGKGPFNIQGNSPRKYSMLTRTSLPRKYSTLSRTNSSPRKLVQLNQARSTCNKQLPPTQTASKLDLLSQISTIIHEERRVELRDWPHSLCVAHGRLYTCEGWSGLGVYNLELEKVCYLIGGKEQFGLIKGAVQTGEDSMAVATSEGCFIVNKIGVVLQQLANGYIDGVCMGSDGSLYTVGWGISSSDNGSSGHRSDHTQVHVYQRMWGGWVKTRQYDSPCTKALFVNKIIHTGNVIYVSCLCNVVYKLNVCLETEEVWQKLGGVEELQSPHVVAANQKGNVLIADAGNGRLVVRSADGRFTELCIKPQLEWPVSAVIAGSKLYVACWWDNSLRCFKMY